ncbi:MAG: His/Gly/Thr/Pro-type tRNA ligase C-terminal domain-containing protein [Parachlamydiaceae bacterium]
MQISSTSQAPLDQQYLASEIMALVVCQLFPTALLVGGGVDSIGFYYDFVFEQPLTDRALELIEVAVRQFAKEEHLVRSISMMRENAKTLLDYHHHPILAEKAESHPLNIIELIQIGDHYGVCPALSLTSSQEIGIVKLLKFSEFARFFEGDEVVVTRIAGVCRNSLRDLKAFLKSYESFLKKKDHRFLGEKLDFFSISPVSGPLGVVWHAKGCWLKRFLIEWLRNQNRQEVFEVSTPSIALDSFLGNHDRAFNSFEFEGECYRLRSSPIRQHLELLGGMDLAPDQLPVRLSESASFYTHIPQPHCWGLLNQSSYVGEQTTICCLKEQVVVELISSLHFIEQIITIFCLEARWVLIASRQKTPKAKQERELVVWLKQAIESQPRLFSFSSEIEEKEEIEGPGLELRVRDVLGREWPVSFLGFIASTESLSLTDQLGKKLFILTCQVWSSIDRFIALLIEHYEGVLPLWLVPEQARILVIGQSNLIYAQDVCKRLREGGLRVKIDCSQSKLGVKVHDAQSQHIPYLIIVGELERLKNTINVRTAEKFHHHQSVDVETFLRGIDLRTCSISSIG